MERSRPRGETAEVLVLFSAASLPRINRFGICRGCLIGEPGASIGRRYRRLVAALNEEHLATGALHCAVHCVLDRLEEQRSGNSVPRRSECAIGRAPMRGDERRDCLRIDPCVGCGEEEKGARPANKFRRLTRRCRGVSCGGATCEWRKVFVPSAA